MYYFDFEVRNLLLQYTARIEVALRTTITYFISNKYKDDPFWLVNSEVVGNNYIERSTKTVMMGCESTALLSDIIGNIQMMPMHRHGRRLNTSHWGT